MKMILTDYIKSYFLVPQDALQEITSLFEETELKKGDFFVKEGHYCNKLSFIKQGTIRIYSNSNQKEITQWIAGTGYFLTDLRSLVFGQPTRWNMQALNDCEFYTISKENYDQLVNVITDWSKLEKQFIANCFLTLEERIFEFLSASAEERYKKLFAQNPSLFNEIPLQYLASMLGMTPETMSRIRAK